MVKPAAADDDRDPSLVEAAADDEGEVTTGLTVEPGFFLSCPTTAVTASFCGLREGYTGETSKDVSLLLLGT